MVVGVVVLSVDFVVVVAIVELVVVVPACNAYVVYSSITHSLVGFCVDCVSAAHTGLNLACIYAVCKEGNRRDFERSRNCMLDVS